MENGNIVGEPFDKYVADQIRYRQKAYSSGFEGLRGNTKTNYLSNRNAWLKLASSVLVENTPNINVEDGTQRLIDLGVSNPERYMNDELAKAFILFNGTQALNPNLTSYTVREGVSKTQEALNNISSNSAYGLGGSNQGIQPIPGIISANIDCINRGSIKKATVEIKVHNKTQFHIIELLYLRLGFSVLLEWGWDKYITEDDKGNEIIKNVENTLTEDIWFQDNTCISTTQSDLIEKIEETREKYKGNYDGFYGRVTNYSWDFNPDGSYNITLSLVTIGDVIESLKINLPSTLSTSNIKELKEKQEEDELTGNFEGFQNSKIIDVAGSNRIGEFLYNNIKNFNNNADFYKLSSQNKNIDDGNWFTRWFSKYAESLPEGTEKYNYFIRFGRFLEFLECFIIDSYSANKEGIVEDSEPIMFIRTESDRQYYKRYPNQISIDPRICLVPPNIKGYEFEDLDIGISEVDDKKINIVDSFNKTLLDGNSVSSLEKGLGKIMNIYLNFEFIATQLASSLDDEGNIFLYKFLEKLCVGINKSLGTINKIQPIIDKDKEVVFIDETLSYEETPLNDDKIEEVELEVYGYNVDNQTSNFVKNIKFETKLDSKIASTISIGATAEGNNTDTVDGTSFSKWNNGLKDKFFRKVYTPTPPPIKEEEREKKKKELEKVFDKNSNLLPLDTAGKFLINVGKSVFNLFKSTTTTKFINSQADVNFNVAKYEITYRDKYYFAVTKNQFINKALKYEDRFKAQKGITKDEDGNFTTIPSWDFYLANCFGGRINNTIFENGEAVGSTLKNEDIRYFELNGDFIANGIQQYKKYIKNFYQKAYNSIQEPSSTIGFIPVTLNLELEGISGIKIYQNLNIRQEFLPPQYPKALKFLITQVNHNISDNNWDTKLTTISTSNIDVKKINKYIESISSPSSNVYGPNQFPEEVNVPFTTKPRFNVSDLSISVQGLNLIKESESFRSKAYDDFKPNVNLTSSTPIEGTLTIGYGFTNSIIPNLRWNSTITEEQADGLLREKIITFEDIVKQQINVPLSQGEFDALVSIVYNSGQLGNTSNGSSTPLLSNINSGEYTKASDIITKYRITSREQISPGLINRRRKEQTLFLT